MSNWGNKLSHKLNVLNEASSKESVQTLAKWIGFNRKHVGAFLPVLREALLQANSPALQVTRISVLHELFILDKDTPEKWGRMEELRVTLAESLLLPLVGQLQETTRDKLRTSFLKEWDDSNAFAGPTLINQLRKTLTSTNNVETTNTASATAHNDDSKALATSETARLDKPAVSASGVESTDSLYTSHQKTVKSTQSESNVPNKDAVAEKVPTSYKDKHPTSSTAKAPDSSSSPPSHTDKAYDFEATGIPAADVDTKTLLDPTHTIASLQIARDLRSDGAVQLSSLLAGLPDDIKKACQDKEELTPDTIRKFLLQTPDTLLDMDLEEQLQSIRMYRDIIKRQRNSRKQLIRTLIQSRCNFGAQYVASAFENADRAGEELQKRKQILMDAMELEGLDVAQDEKDLDSGDAVEFAPLEWYKKPRLEA